MSELDFRVVVPARYASTRLPGKPLLPIAGRPMILHVLDRAREADASDVIVATDDARIAAVVSAAGGQAMLTSPDHASGTDRLAEVAARAGWPDDAIVVNLQGDEPCVPGRLARTLAESLACRVGTGLATLAAPIHTPRELFDPNVVKTVLDQTGLALTFSRAPLPWVRGAFEIGAVPTTLPAGVPFLRHVGLYAYRVATLRQLASAAAAAIEQAEALEQLRALWLGIRIHVTVLPEAPGHGVDTAADLARIEALLSLAQ